MMELAKASINLQECKIGFLLQTKCKYITMLLNLKEKYVSLEYFHNDVILQNRGKNAYTSYINI